MGLHRQLELANATQSVAAPPWIALAIVFAAITLNFGLCFLNTHYRVVTAAHVITGELLIICSALLYSVRALRATSVAFSVALFCYLASLALLRSRASSTPIDIKGIRDFVIPIAFFLLGKQVPPTKVDRQVWALGALVTSVALLEYFYVDTYLSYFDVIDYYVARGSVEAESLEILSTNLFVSGVRPEGEGRTLLPFLGPIRASSIFLEPVSLGNFGAILFSWALIRREFRGRIPMLAVTVFLVIMADSRFGVLCCAIAIILSLLPVHILNFLVRWIPWISIAMLLSLGFSKMTPGNGAFERLVNSGAVLWSFDALTWFGSNEPSLPTVDAGYAYVIRAAGVFGFGIAWYIFTTLPGTNEFNRFRALAGFYLAIILCVSYSPFTIKTGALMWFMLGSLAIEGDSRQVVRAHGQLLTSRRTANTSAVVNT